jgi:hypothetical protein
MFHTVKASSIADLKGLRLKVAENQGYCSRRLAGGVYTETAMRFQGLVDGLVLPLKPSRWDF